MHHLSNITLKNISKVEGKANLRVKIKGKKVKKVEFQISEYKRFYTWAIKGKNINALPQLVSRICGTCSIAHLLCAIEAIETALSINSSEQTKLLRQLLMYGLIIRDHALHLYFFALPDYLEKDSILEFDEGSAREHQLLHDAFTVKKAGNLLSTWIGGRAVHAMFPKVGGFVKLPDIAQKSKIINQLKSAREKIFRAINIFAEDKFNFERKTNYAALTSFDFNFLEGKLISSHGWEIPESEYENHLEHVIIPYSMSSGYKLDKEPYRVGALARLNLNKKSIHSKTQKDCQRYLAKFPSSDIYLNNLAQAIEIIHSIDHSLEILDSLEIKEEQPIIVNPKKSTGIGVIEAPRGLLFYKLEIDDSGHIRDGQIVVPTSQNQINIELDIKKLVEDNIERSQIELEHMIEMLIRAYDPCLSCASHFLKVRWEKSQI